MVEPAENEVNARHDVETLRADVLYVLSQSDADRRFEAAVAVMAHLPPVAAAPLLDAESIRTRTACDDALRVVIDAKGGTRAMASRWTERLRPRSAAMPVVTPSGGVVGAATGGAPLPGTVDLSTWRRPMIAVGLTLVAGVAALVFLPSEVVNGTSDDSAVTTPEHRDEGSAITLAGTSVAAGDGSNSTGGTQQRGSKGSTTTTTHSGPPTTLSPPVSAADRSEELALDRSSIAGAAESSPVTSPRTTQAPTTAVPTTAVPTTPVPTTAAPTTAVSTTAVPATLPTVAAPTSVAPAPAPTTVRPPTTVAPASAAVEEAPSPREVARLERQQRREARRAAREAALAELAAEWQRQQDARNAAREAAIAEQAARDTTRAEQADADNNRGSDHWRVDHDNDRRNHRDRHDH